ncbi:MAG: molybdate ABC transporter permease subunit [Propionibacteriaceae bacterium]|jgi:molybdate transport system permease protein|nr:molybdate ABC transporter permease subunit [Propionibacteriaceae bacterium]
MRRTGLPKWALVVALVSLSLVVGPVVALLIGADWRTIPTALASPVARQALVLTVTTSSLATLACVVTGVPTALVLSRCPPRLAGLARAIGLIPLVLPPMVSGLALLSWLGRHGLAGQVLDTLGLRIPFTTVAVVIAQTFVAWPFLVVAVEASLRVGGREVERVAASLGATPSRVFWTITWPLIRPGLRGGVVLCFARAVGEFGATALFAGNLPGRTQTMPLAIYASFNGTGADHNLAVGLAVILVGLSVLLLALSGSITRSRA